MRSIEQTKNMRTPYIDKSQYGKDKTKLFWFIIINILCCIGLYLSNIMILTVISGTLSILIFFVNIFIISTIFENIAKRTFDYNIMKAADGSLYVTYKSRILFHTMILKVKRRQEIFDIIYANKIANNHKYDMKRQLKNYFDVPLHIKAIDL